ncbi:MAG: HAD family hydrolase [Sphingomonadaceae bacterium]|nr:HAD family hydrolase [Sphingomonadaceae bacterium]
MSRPLIITDCDEVLLHMVSPFRDWLDETQGVDFIMQGADFANALRWKESGEPLAPAEIWEKLGGFFDTEMHRQTPIDGAIKGITTLREHADVVVLTNLTDERRDNRARQLADHGLVVEVFTNQGPKGPALQKIIEDHGASRAIFIDDLPQHHHSASETVPHVRRLHLCGEPMIAPHINCAHEAGHAHARIDCWHEALPWLLGQLDHQPDEEKP